MALAYGGRLTLYKGSFFGPADNDSATIVVPSGAHVVVSPWAWQLDGGGIEITAISGLTGLSGPTWTAIDDEKYDGSSFDFATRSWWAYFPSGGTGEVRVTVNTTYNVDVQFEVIYWTGADTTNPIDLTRIASANGGTNGSMGPVTLSARTASNNHRYASFIAAAQASAWFPGSGYTLISGDNGNGSTLLSMYDATDNSNDATTTPSNGNVGWAGVSFDVVEATGGGPTFDTFGHDMVRRGRIFVPRRLADDYAVPGPLFGPADPLESPRRQITPKRRAALEAWILDRMQPALDVIVADSTPNSHRRQVIRPQEPQVVLTALSGAALAAIAPESTATPRRSQKPRTAPTSDLAPVVEQGLSVIAAEDQSWHPRRRLPPKPPEGGNLGAIAALALPHDSPVRRFARPLRQAPQDRPVSAVAGQGLLSFVTDTPVIQRRKARRVTYIVDGPSLELIEVIPTYPDIVIELGTIHTFAEGITEFRFTEPEQEHGFAQQEPTVFKFVRKLF